MIFTDSNDVFQAKQYFRDLDRHVSIYAASGAADAEAIDMAFSKDRAADRRTATQLRHHYDSSYRAVV